MAVMFFKDAGGVDTPHESSMVANALTQLQSNKGLRAILMIVGILLVTYGEQHISVCQMSSRTSRLHGAHVQRIWLGTTACTVCVRRGQSIDSNTMACMHKHTATAFHQVRSQLVDPPSLHTCHPSQVCSQP